MSLYLGNKKINHVGVIFEAGDTTYLNASNIKTGVSIMGITGTFSDDSTLGGGETAATSDTILTSYSAFINGTKVNGSLVVNNYYTGSSEPSSSLGKNGDIYLKR